MIARQRFGRRDQRRRLPRIAQQQPRAGNGRERNRQLELGIISAAGAHIGVRPVLIEDIFALAVALGIGGGDGRRAALGIVDDEMDGLPSRARSVAARFLQSGEKLGRAQCWERECQYVWIAVGAVSTKKIKKQKSR